MALRNLARLVPWDGQKLFQRRRIHLNVCGLLHQRQVIKLRVADHIAFMHHVVADGGQQPFQCLIRGLFPGQPHAHGVTGEVVIAELAFDLHDPRGGAVGGKVVEQIQACRIHADDQAIRLKIIKQHPHQGAPVAVAFFQSVLDAAQIRQRRVELVKEVLNRGHICDLPNAFQHPLGHMPFLADHDQQFPVPAKGAFRFPKTGGKAASVAALAGEELEQAPPLIADLKIDTLRHIEQPQTALEVLRLGADLARKEIVLRQQQIVVIVIEGHRHAVVGEHQKRQRARADLLARHQVAHQGLKECLIRYPGGAEKPHDIAAFLDKGQQRLNGLPAQAPPLRTDHDLQIFGDLAFEAQAFLQLEHGVEQLLVFPLVHVVAVDQPLFFPARLDPVAFEIVKAFNEISVFTLKKLMGVFGRFDRHAIARQHVEMRGPRKGINRGLDRVDRGLHQRPFPPAAFHPLFGEGDIGVVGQCRLDLLEVFGVGRGIKMDRHAIPHSRQTFRLPDDGIGVLVTQEDVGNLGHFGGALRFVFVGLQC